MSRETTLSVIDPIAAFIVKGQVARTLLAQVDTLWEAHEGSWHRRYVLRSAVTFSGRIPAGD